VVDFIGPICEMISFTITIDRVWAIFMKTSTLCEKIEIKIYINVPKDQNRSKGLENTASNNNQVEGGEQEAYPKKNKEYKKQQKMAYIYNRIILKS
jgi:hypothetical protein